ncbi:hypothetical protein O9993_02810 [Vibrio lentus]|nr:hypothetical protein [Vibrio lentus]
MILGLILPKELNRYLIKVTIQIDLYGSLSLTGIGHHTDRATY